MYEQINSNFDTSSIANCLLDIFLVMWNTLEVSGRNYGEKKLRKINKIG